MIEPALAWLEEEPGTPFFLSLLTVSTHHDYESPFGIERFAEIESESERNYYRNVHLSGPFPPSGRWGSWSGGASSTTRSWSCWAITAEAFGEHGQIPSRTAFPSARC